MFSKFKYEEIPLGSIFLDTHNPRIVTQTRPTTQDQILRYLFEHEDLAGFIKRIVYQGKNKGAERPYVVRKPSSKSYIVVEGNTRIAAYKLLAGMLKAPTEYASAVPAVTPSMIDGFKMVECAIAPTRDDLLPIMATAHFGLGDKSKWGYLGSRKAVYDEWKAGKTPSQLAKAFDITKGQVSDLILEYLLYLEALKFNWGEKEKEILLDPSVAFNPPVRFLQGTGHKESVGVSYDKSNLSIAFVNSEARNKFRHLVYRLVIQPSNGLSATSTYADVFKDYWASAEEAPTSSADDAAAPSEKPSQKSDGSGVAEKAKDVAADANPSLSKTAKAGALFPYAPKVNSSLLAQLMREARDINTKKFPASATFLLRNILEALLKHLIHEQNANSAGKKVDLEGALNLCQSSVVTLPPEDKKILKEFQKSHLDYVNLGAHGNVVPNYERLASARDCIDQFIKKNC